MFEIKHWGKVKSVISILFYVTPNIFSDYSGRAKSQRSLGSFLGAGNSRFHLSKVYFP